MQQRGVELFKGGLFFGEGRLQHIYIHGDLCFTFYIIFDLLFVFCHSAASVTTRSQTKVLAQ